MSQWYKLVDGEPVRCKSVAEGAAAYDERFSSIGETGVDPWSVRNDEIEDPSEEKPVRVSTVFLGLDHRPYGTAEPVLWETMIFGGEHDDYQERYTSREAAEEGHARAVSLVRGSIAPADLAPVTT